MLNKKAGIPANQIFGFLTYVFVAVIFIVSFYGCNVADVKRTYETFDASTDEIKVAKAMNFFLESTAYEEKIISDIIIESYLSNDYSKFGKLTREYFLKFDDEYRLMLIDSNGNILYDSFASDFRIPSTGIAYNILRLPVTKNAEDIDFIQIILQIYQTENVE